jgi:hypothetical protein
VLVLSPVLPGEADRGERLDLAHVLRRSSPRLLAGQAVAGDGPRPTNGVYPGPNSDTSSPSRTADLDAYQIRVSQGLAMPLPSLSEAPERGNDVVRGRHGGQLASAAGAGVGVEDGTEGT